MATLENELRATNTGGASEHWVVTFGREALRTALQTCGHFYGYGLFDEASTPKVKLQPTEIIQGLKGIGDEIQERWERGDQVVITDDLAQGIAVIFHHLPNAVSQEGWSEGLINAVSEACCDLNACTETQNPQRNLLIHSVLGDLVNVNTIPPPIAGPMLNMVLSWADLTWLVVDREQDQSQSATKRPRFLQVRPTTTYYWDSTLEIGRRAALQASDALRTAYTLQRSGETFGDTSAWGARMTLAKLDESLLITRLLNDPESSAQDYLLRG